MSLIRFPLTLPPVQKRRRRASWWRAFWGFVVMVLLCLLLIYGVSPALEVLTEQAAEDAQETR